MKNTKHPPYLESQSNAKQVGIALFDFETEYGRFPDATTAAKVKAVTGTPLALGSGSSNQLFRQLIAQGLKSEKIFWAPTSYSPRKPDDLFVSDATALAPGECGLTYVTGLSSTDDPRTPVLMTPVIRGTRTFDRKDFNGRAVVLFLDMSARHFPIDKHGRVMIRGKDIFDPTQPYWRGKTPDIKWPE